MPLLCLLWQHRSTLQLNRVKHSKSSLSKLCFPKVLRHHQALSQAKRVSNTFKYYKKIVNTNKSCTVFSCWNIKPVDCVVMPLQTMDWFPEACQTQSNICFFLDSSQFCAWWLNKWKPGGNKLSGLSTAAINCAQIQEMICSLVTLVWTISRKMTDSFSTLHSPATKSEIR